MKKKVIQNVCFLAIIGIAVIAFWQVLSEAVLEMRFLKPWQVVAMAFLGIVYQIMDGLNFSSMAQLNHPEYRAMDGFECAFYTSFFRVTSFGSAPSVATTYDMHKKGIPASEGMAISAINYMFHKVMIAVICMVFGLWTMDTLLGLGGHYLWYYIASLCLVIPISAVLIGFCVSRTFHRCMLWLLRKFDSKQKWAERIESLDDQMKNMRIVAIDQLKNKHQIPLMLFRHVIKQIAIYIIPFVVLYDDLPNGDFFLSLALTAVAIAIAGVMPSPGGIGSTELAFVLLFAGLTTNEKILSASLLYRFFSYIFPGLLGGAMILVQRAMKKHSERNRKM